MGRLAGCPDVLLSDVSVCSCPAAPRDGSVTAGFPAAGGVIMWQSRGLRGGRASGSFTRRGGGRAFGSFSRRGCASQRAADDSFPPWWMFQQLRPKKGAVVTLCYTVWVGGWACRYC